MSRPAFLALLLLILSPLLPAQDAGESAGKPPPEEGGEEAGFGFLPVALLVNAVYAGTFPWRPDWTPGFPPDGFVLSSGAASSITLTVDSADYTLRRNAGGFLEEFPFPLDGTLRGVQADLDSLGALRGFRIGGEIPSVIEVLEYSGSPFFPVPVPARARVLREERVSFVVLAYKPGGFSETWFDAEGGGLAFWEADFIFLDGENLPRRLEGADPEGALLGEWDYDSGGNLTAIREAEGIYSALYNRRGFPRYWERRISPEAFESYTLQWDEGGLLVRLSGFSGPGDGDRIDFRYEYTLDERGNWTERRETRMFRHLGYLFPGPGFTVKRVINYNTSE
jgi:hypothetical protein